jgi:arginyl-tRNA synthetase
LPDDWEERPQRLFRSTQFGDDVDRPLLKADGTATYFANDVGYHLDKIRRGFKKMIVFWGADHGGYIKRMQAAVKALDEEATLDVAICQLVKLLKNGQPYKMSKRAGTFITARDVLEDVGRDVLRIAMLTRRHDAALELDIDVFLAQSADNPVFYLHYANARCHSILRHLAETGRCIR